MVHLKEKQIISSRLSLQGKSQEADKLARETCNASEKGIYLTVSYYNKQILEWLPILPSPFSRKCPLHRVYKWDLHLFWAQLSAHEVRKGPVFVSLNMKSLPGVGMETPKLWSVCWIHVKADHVKKGRPSPNVLPSEEKAVCKWGRYAAENKNERHLKRAGRMDEKHLFQTLWFLGADHGRQDPFSAKEFWQIPLRPWVTCPFFLAGRNFSCWKPNDTYFYWPRQKMDSYTWDVL